MKVWRLHQSRFAPDDPTGSRLFGGRWNSVGTGAIYVSLSASSTILETRVHLETKPYHPYSLSTAQIEIIRLVDLTEIDWKDSKSCRSRGDEHLLKPETFGMLVPSATTNGHDQNVVLNPLNLEVQRLDWESFAYPLDARLWK